MRTNLLLLMWSAPLALALAANDPGYERILKQPPTLEEIDSIHLLPTMVDGISYIGGGVGVAERAALAQQAKDYTLRIEIARKNGEYLGDMRVRVLNAVGKTLLDAPSNGPLFYIQLAKGHYVVEVSPLDPPTPMSASLTPQTRKVNIISGKQTRLLFLWP